MCNTEPRQRNLIIIFAVKSCVSDVISRLKTSYEASFFLSLHIRAIPTINFRQVTIFTMYSSWAFFQNVCVLSLSVKWIVSRSKAIQKKLQKCLNVVFGRSQHHFTIWCHKFLWLIVGISFWKPYHLLHKTPFASFIHLQIRKE